MIASCLALAARAQVSPVVKQPGGPGVWQDSQGNYVVAPGNDIVWTVTVVNDSGSPTPLAVDFVDSPQDPECALGGGGNSNETAPQATLVLPDVNGNGNCGDTGDAVLQFPSGSVVDCNSTTQQLHVTGIVVAPGASATVQFRTNVSATASQIGQSVCNWGHFVDSTTGNPIFSTVPPGSMTQGCSCLNIAPTPVFGFTGEKTVALDNPPPLIPNDLNATVVYSIVARNTGTQDITTGSMSDTLPTGMEWVSIVDCPSPLSCVLTPPDRLDATGYVIPAGDPDPEVIVRARARVTCALVGPNPPPYVACNQAHFSFNGQDIPTDDPSTPAVQDPTCVNAQFSYLGGSTLAMASYDDANSNAQLDPGEKVHWVLHESNGGGVTARSVVATVNLSAVTCIDPASVTVFDGGSFAGGVITWPAADLAAASSADLHFDSTILVSGPCCIQGTLQSQERADCHLSSVPTDDPTTPSTPRDPTCVSPGAQPQISIAKDWCLEPPPPTGCDRTNVPNAGDSVRWTVTITNSGAGTAHQVVFHDPLAACFPGFDATVTITGGGTNNSRAANPPALDPGLVEVDGVGGADGLNPGETVTIEWVTQVALVPGCCNQGNVTFAEARDPQPSDDPATPGRVDDATCVGPPDTSAAGQLVKTVTALDDAPADGHVTPGDHLLYTLTFQNVGGTPLDAVEIRDVAPACTDFETSTVAISPASLGTDASTSTDVIVDLAAGLQPAQRVTITFVAKILSSGNCCNQASWTSTQVPGPSLSDANPSNIVPDEATCYPVESPPPPTCQMTFQASTSATTACTIPGSTVDWTWIVTNVGESDVASWLVVDSLPPDYANIVADPPLTESGGTVVLDGAGSVGTLTPGSSVTCHFHADVPCTATGSVSDTATLTYNCPLSTNNVPMTTTVTWGGPDLTTSFGSVTFDDTNSNGVVDAGERVRYALKVINTGACDALGIVVSDDLDARFKATTLQFGMNPGTQTGSTLTWIGSQVPALADLAPGASVELDFDVLVDPTTSPGSHIPDAFTAVAQGSVAGGCAAFQVPGVLAQGQASAVTFGVAPPPLDLLRNALIGCPASALATEHSIMRTAVSPAAQPSLDPVRDLAISSAVPPASFIGDAAWTAPACPQAASGEGGVLVFYETSDPAALLHVSKSGIDVVVTW